VSTHHGVIRGQDGGGRNQRNDTHLRKLLHFVFSSLPVFIWPAACNTSGAQDWMTSISLFCGGRTQNPIWEFCSQAPSRDIIGKSPQCYPNGI
jgi:hypothetical protein